MTTPDIAGDVVGWRLFYLNQHTLLSPQRRTVWPYDGWLDAGCNAYDGGDGDRCHMRMTRRHVNLQGDAVFEHFTRDALVPNEHCHCGIYALDTPGEALRRGVMATQGARVGGLVLGSVLLEGRYIRHDNGWRVQRAKLRSIATRAYMRVRIEAVAERYDIPVIDGPLAERADAYIVDHVPERLIKAQAATRARRNRQWRTIREQYGGTVGGPFVGQGAVPYGWSTSNTPISTSNSWATTTIATSSWDTGPGWVSIDHTYPQIPSRTDPE